MAILGATTLTGCNSIPGFISSGTLVLFEQETAPPSWTRSTNILGGGNGTLRVTNGTVGSGGTVDFTNAFNTKSSSGSIDAHTLTTTQIPSHTHGNASTAIQHSSAPRGTQSVRTYAGSIGLIGGGGSHSHPFSASVDFDIVYVDYILASKD
jgi:hypothetical protein